MTEMDGEMRDTFVIGASAGGIEALLRLLPPLGEASEASVFIVQHLPADGRSALDTVLRRATRYEVAFAGDGEAILPRRVYLAPPDRHLVIQGDQVRLLYGARENHSRPAIDALFRSAAVARRGRVVGAILSGLLDDGSAGLLAVKRCGGLAFVQASEDAIEPEMPGAAARALAGELDGALAAGELGRRLAALAGTPAPGGSVPAELALELRMQLGEVNALEALQSAGSPVAVSCPECGGPLWAVADERLTRYRCHTGHVHTPETFLSAQALAIEQALWAAIKGLEQRSQMLMSFGRDPRLALHAASKRRYEEEAARLREHAETLRALLVASQAPRARRD